MAFGTFHVKSIVVSLDRCIVSGNPLIKLELHAHSFAILNLYESRNCKTSGGA